MIAFLREPLAINSLAKSGNVTRSPEKTIARTDLSLCATVAYNSTNQTQQSNF